MARLEGERKSPVPLLIGVALLALVAIGGYYAYQNRSADTVAVAPGEVNVVDNKPGNMVSNGDVDAHRDGNTVTIGSDADSNGTEGGNNTDGAAASGGEGSNQESGNTTDANADSATTSDASGSASAMSGSNEQASGGASGGASSAASEKTGKGIVAERSKTIKNDKTKTTVTYQKKIHEDGSVSHSKSTAGAGAAPGATSTTR